jgi:hypothetical protein
MFEISDNAEAAGVVFVLGAVETALRWHLLHIYAFLYVAADSNRPSLQNQEVALPIENRREAKAKSPHCLVGLIPCLL